MSSEQKEDRKDGNEHSVGQESFARAIALVDGKLDWDLLSELHGASQDEGYFAPAQRDAMLETGLSFATDLAARLAPAGRSLYLGAAVAELAPMLFETLILEREVLWLNLEGEESREYQRVLGEVSKELSLPLSAPVTQEISDLPSEMVFDHLWLVSVLTDPSSFPGLHDALYSRGGSHESADPKGHADLALERTRALALGAGALGRVRPVGSQKALVTSTDEEWPLLLEAAASLSITCELEQRARLSGLVGDPVRFGSCSATMA